MSRCHLLARGGNRPRRSSCEHRSRHTGSRESADPPRLWTVVACATGRMPVSRETHVRASRIRPGSTTQCAIQHPGQSRIQTRGTRGKSTVMPAAWLEIIPDFHRRSVREAHGSLVCKKPRHSYYSNDVASLQEGATRARYAATSRQGTYQQRIAASIVHRYDVDCVGWPCRHHPRRHASRAATQPDRQSLFVLRCRAWVAAQKNDAQPDEPDDLAQAKHSNHHLGQPWDN